MPTTRRTRNSTRGSGPEHGPGLRRTVAIATLLLLPGLALANQAPIIDDFRASSTTVLPGGIVTLTVDAHDPDCPDTCTTGCGLYVRSDLTQWKANGGTFPRKDNGTSGSPYSANADWQAPETEDTYRITVELSDSGTFLCGGRETTSASLDILVTTSTNEAPVVESLTADPDQVFPGETSQLTCVASDPEGDPVTYSWNAERGTVDDPDADGTATYTAGDPGIDTVTCTASDPEGASGSDSISISVVGALAEKGITSGLVSPQRLSIDSMGNVYVVDRSGGGLTVIHLFSGSLVYRLPIPGARSVAVDWADRLLVGKVDGAAVLDRRGQILFQLIPGQRLSDVSDVAVDPVNRRYGVLHRSAGRVVVYDELGTQIAAFGSTGRGSTQFRSPQGLAATPEGNWAVGDTGSGKIKIFDLAGNLLSSFGDLGGGVGEFVALDDVAVDADGIVYASDSFQDWVQTFNPDGSPRETLGTYGGDAGEFKTVTGVAPAESFDRLLAASANSSSVQVFFTRSDPTPEGPSPEASHSPTRLAFSDQAVDTTSGPESVTVTNSGDAPLGVREIVVAGEFEQTSDCLPFVDPGGTCEIRVTFSPRAAGPREGSMSIDTSSEGGSLVVALSGSGFVPAGVRLSRTFWAFPDQFVETMSEAEPVILTNTGTVPLEVLSVAASGEYTESDDCPGSLPGGASCTLSIRFAPLTIADNIPGSVTIDSSAPDSPHVIELDGRGIPGRPDIAIGDVTVRERDGEGAVATFEVNLGSPGDEAVVVDYATVDDTATAGEDYESASGKLTFPPGDTFETLSVSILDDGILEPDEESFYVELSNPLGGVLVDGRGLGTLLDDERCLGPDLLANGGAEQRSDGSDIPGWTPVSGLWRRVRDEVEAFEGKAFLSAGTAGLAELAQDVDASAFADFIDRGRQRFAFEGYLRSSNGPEPDTARVVVEYRNWDNTTVIDAYDSGDISSPGRWVRVADERAAPEGTRWIRLRLIGAWLGETGDDVRFDALSLRSLRAATLLVADVSEYEGATGADNALSFSANLACAYHQEVSASYGTADGTAVDGIDYFGRAGALVLPRGETTEGVSVPIVGDDEDEAHETVILGLLATTPDDVVRLDVEAVGTIVNDDFCPRGHGYWKKRSESWPIGWVEIGGVEYERAQMAELLDYKGGNVPSLLAQQMVTAKLNLAVGSDPSILPTVEQADTYLAIYPPGSDPPKVPRKTGRQLIDRLSEYNNGACK